MLQTEFIPGQTALAPLADKGEHVGSTLFHFNNILGVKLQTVNQSGNMWLVGRIQMHDKQQFLTLQNGHIY